MTTNKTAYVVGFMGSGKSSILKVINQSTNINTVDLDELVVKDNGESILKIFRNPISSTPGCSLRPSRPT